MTDVSWTLKTSPDGDVTADTLLGSAPSVRRGETTAATFEFGTSSAYTTIREYLDFAGRASTLVALDGTPYYRENHNDTEELLIGVNPSGADLPSEYLGWWGILMGGADQTPGANTVYRVEMEFFVLDEFSNLADRSAAKSTHER